MIIARDSNNNWTPVATGNGQFVGTKAAFDAVKDVCARIYMRAYGTASFYGDCMRCRSGER